MLGSSEVSVERGLTWTWAELFTIGCIQRSYLVAERSWLLFSMRRCRHETEARWFLLWIKCGGKIFVACLSSYFCFSQFNLLLLRCTKTSEHFYHFLIPNILIILSQIGTNKCTMSFLQKDSRNWNIVGSTGIRTKVLPLIRGHLFLQTGIGPHFGILS